MIQAARFSTALLLSLTEGPTQKERGEGRETIEEEGI